MTGPVVRSRRKAERYLESARSPRSGLAGDEDVVALGLEVAGDLGPAGGVGPGAVHEDHRGLLGRDRAVLLGAAGGLGGDDAGEDEARDEREQADRTKLPVAEELHGDS